MPYENILFEKADRVARITLNRPERLNAFVGTMREEIYEALCNVKQMTCAPSS
jgi:2-(1,2-epoxy-1,2-dihydrophenyl)acetyl-CoA isomerase